MLATTTSGSGAPLPPPNSRTAIIYDIASQAPGPRLYSPLVAPPPAERSVGAAGAAAAAHAPSSSSPSSVDTTELPIMYYLPGIDGTGLAASRQFPRLAERFALRCLLLPPSDRMPFAQLADSVSSQIAADVAANGNRERPVYLLGESFGATLALAVAAALPSVVDRVVLVNPATSFTRSPWPTMGPLLPLLPPQAYSVLPLVLSPVLSNPLAMAANALSGRPGQGPAQQAAELATGLVDLLPQLSSLRLVLPAETLAHRLTLLQQGAVAVEALLPK